MKINSAQEFLGFVRSNGLVALSPEVQAFVVCMEQFSRMCPCDPESAKVAKMNQCKSFYISFIRGASKFTNQLISKTPDGSIIFCADGQYVSTIKR